MTNMIPSPAKIDLKRLLWIAFCRAPIEQSFQRCKQRVGMGHFEVRGWLGIHRHFYITQLSFLFCSIMHNRLREKNHKKILPDSRAGSSGSFRVSRRSTVRSNDAKTVLSENVRQNLVSSETQSAGRKSARKRTLCKLRKLGIKIRQLKSCILHDY